MFSLPGVVIVVCVTSTPVAPLSRKTALLDLWGKVGMGYVVNKMLALEGSALDYHAVAT